MGEIKIISIKLKLRPDVVDIINKYDITALFLRTLPRKNIVDPIALAIYSKKFNTSITILTTVDVDIDQDVLSIIANLANQYNTTPQIMFNYLIECQADLSRIHTKNISQALNKYYDILTQSPEYAVRSILNAFSSSPCYSDARGLNEEDLAYFLISETGQALLNNFKNKNII